MVARAHGRRQSAAETRNPIPSRLVGLPRSATVFAAIGNRSPRISPEGHLTSVFHADTHSEYGTQSALPLSQVAMGVFHSAMESK